MTTTIRAGNAEAVAAHYHGDFDGQNWRMACPSHHGDGKNLSVRDGDKGGLIVTCWSHECTYNQVLAAFQRDGLEVARQWEYRPGKVVRRVDRAGSKDMRGNPGSTKGLPILIRGDSPDALIVLCEGESDADAVLAADLPGVAVGSWAGGAKMAGAADYEGVRGRRVAIWPDHDVEGVKALAAAGAACTAVGAASVEVVPSVGDDGNGYGAADLVASAVDVWIAARTAWAEEAPAPSRLVFTSLADILATPAAEWLINGLIAAGSTSLVYGPPKGGKTMLLLAMLRAASKGSPFLGQPVMPMRSWLISEQSEHSLAPQLRMLNIAPDAQIEVALWRHQIHYASPDDFAESVYQTFIHAPERPRLLVVDTLSAFIDLQDSNDYSMVHQKLQPVIQMAQTIASIEGTATVLTHHSRKSGGDGSDAVLGSRAIAGLVDNLIHLTIAKDRGGGS